MVDQTDRSPKQRIAADAGSLPLRKPRNLQLQILRGIAATMVVVYHAAHFTALKTNTPWLGELFGPRLGFYGVLMFFVLSGYLMQGAVQRYKAGKFLLHRLVRLFPTYWALVAILVFVQYLRTGALQHVSWQALTLLPFGQMYRPLAVEWTLLYEVFFYLICSILCFMPRISTFVFAGWLLVVLVAASAFNQFGTTFQPNIVQVPFSLWNVGFIAGALLAQISPRLLSIPAEVWIIVAIPLMLVGELVGPGTRIVFAVFGLCCITQVAIIQARAVPEVHGMGMRTWVLIGEYSYGLYLAHSMTIQIALQYGSSTRHASPFAIFAAILGVGLAVGILAGKLDFELYKRLKRLADYCLDRGRPTNSTDKIAIENYSGSTPPKQAQLVPRIDS